MEKLDIQNYTIPNMTKEDSNAIFNCLHILCEKMETFFKANNDEKDFVYDCVDRKTRNMITVRISKESESKAVQYLKEIEK